jgi:hypothetical protein
MFGGENEGSAVVVSMWQCEHRRMHWGNRRSRKREGSRNDRDGLVLTVISHAGYDVTLTLWPCTCHAVV